MQSFETIGAVFRIDNSRVLIRQLLSDGKKPPNC